MCHGVSFSEGDARLERVAKRRRYPAVTDAHRTQQHGSSTPAASADALESAIPPVAHAATPSVDTERGSYYVGFLHFTYLLPCL